MTSHAPCPSSKASACRTERTLRLLIWLIMKGHDALTIGRGREAPVSAKGFALAESPYMMQISRQLSFSLHKLFHWIGYNSQDKHKK